MLFLKRLGTAALFSFILAILLAKIILAGMAGVAAAQKATVTQSGSAMHFRQALLMGRKTGVETKKKYGLTVGMYALGFSAVVASALAFGGAFPWCRRAALPPPLPRGA